MMAHISKTFKNYLFPVLGFSLLIALILAWFHPSIQESLAFIQQDNQSENTVSPSNLEKRERNNRCDTQPADPCVTIKGPSIEVPRQVPTIQEAINHLTNRGTVVIAEGVYKENVVIPDARRIRITARGRAQRTIITAADPLKPVVTVSPDASVCLRSLTLLGGSVGVQAGQIKPQPIPNSVNLQTSQNLHPATDVSLHNISVAKATNGLILNSQRALVMKTTVIDNSHWGIVSVSPETKVCNSSVSSNGFGGILFEVLDSLPLPCVTAPGTFFPVSGSVIGTDIVFNEGPGIVVCNANGLGIDLNWLSSNKISNILVNASDDVEITNNGVWSARTQDGSWGDGIQIMDGSNADIVGNGIWFNPRSGVYFNASGGSLTSNTVSGSTFACALEEGADPLVSGNDFFGNEGNECAVGLGLEPPPPVNSP